MKKAIVLTLCYLTPILIVLTLGVLQGAWFDGDAWVDEGYKIPQRHYFVYFSVVGCLTIWSIFINWLYFKQKSRPAARYINFTVCSLSALFCLVGLVIIGCLL